MQILITPEDIIKRCLWLEYKKFVLKGKNEDEIDDIIIKNKPDVLSENDAYVIGLLRVVETEDLIHRFNKDINDLLTIKSTIHNVNGDNKVLINKFSLLKEMMDFKERFPVSYDAKQPYKDAIKEVKEYVTKIYDDISKMTIYTIIIKEKTYTFVLSSNVKKIIDDKELKNDIIKKIRKSK